MGLTIDIGDGRAAVEVATTEDLAKHFVELRDWISDAATREEIIVDLPGPNGQGSFVTPNPANTFTFFNLGGPNPGWLWDVMRLSINGNDPTATVAGNCFAFVAGRAPTNSNAPDPLGPMVEVGTGTIPNTAFYSRQQFVVRPGQRLIIGAKSLPVTTQVFVGGQAVQYRDPAAGTPVNTVRRQR